MINDKYMDLLKTDYKQSYIRYMKKVRMEAWGSHQPLLIHMLNTITKGNVVEFGMGYHSTPLMHFICTLQGRKLLSIDHEPDWFAKFTGYKYDDHSMVLVEEPRFMAGDYPFFKEKYAIAFVDGGLSRQTFINLTRRNVDYFVVHDTEEIIFNWDKPQYKYDFSGFKHILHFEGKASILSDLDKIDKHIMDLWD